MTGRDKAALSIIGFFAVMAWTVEFFWLRHAYELPVRDDFLARGFWFYGLGDRGYYDQVSPFEVGLEAVHQFVTTPAYFVLAFGIMKKRAWRWPLQVCLGSYVSYSVLLYFAAKHMTGYIQTPVHDMASFLILYLPNLPWLFGSLYLAADAGCEIMRAASRRAGGAT